MNDLSIIIVSWNAKRYLEECLTSLFATDGTLAMEVIVVENASTDGTPEMIRSQFPQVRLIETGANLGFARGNNVGIALARGKYICLINSDVNVPPDCLPKMYRYMEDNPSIGLLGPQMLRPGGTAVRSGMRFPSLWNVFIRALALDSFFKGNPVFGGRLMSDFKFNETKDLDVLNGWFWMARSEAVETVGGLDEQFFMYGEDMDWCKRFHLSGWRVVFYSEAAALHYGGASSANAPVRFYVEQQRANLQYWKKYHNAASLLIYIPAVWLEQAVRTVGWLLLSLGRRSPETKAVVHFKRSAACLKWLSGHKKMEEMKG